VKPAGFVYHRPASLEEALAQLAAGAPHARLLAGGQSLAPMLNMRLASPEALIDLNDLSELAYIRQTDGALEIGALTRHDALANSPLVQTRCPLLGQAARTIGHYAIRQRGTLGGSLAHADPAAQLPLAAVTLGATLSLLSSRGRREMAADEFFLSAMSTALHADEIILSVRFPVQAAGEASAFELFSRRRGDFAIVAVAASVCLRQRRFVERVRLGVSGVDAVPRRLDLALPIGEAQLADAAWAEEAARSVAAIVTPEEDARIPARYRQELVQTLVQRALAKAVDAARE